MNQRQYCQLLGHQQYIITHLCTNPKCRNISKLCQKCIYDGLHKNDEGYSEYYFHEIPMGPERLNQVKLLAQEKQNLKCLIVADYIFNQKQELHQYVRDIHSQLQKTNIGFNKLQNSNQSAFDILFQNHNAFDQHIHDIKLKEFSINLNEVQSTIEKKLDQLYVNKEENQSIINDLKARLYNDKMIEEFGLDELQRLLFIPLEQHIFISSRNQQKIVNQQQLQQSIFDSHIIENDTERKKQNLKVEQKKLDRYSFNIIQIYNKQKKQQQGRVRRLTCCGFKPLVCLCTTTWWILLICFIIFCAVFYQMIKDKGLDYVKYNDIIPLEFSNHDSQQILYNKGEYEKYIAYLKNSPTYLGKHKIYNNIANAYFKSIQYDESEYFYKAALSAMVDPIIYYNYANLLTNQKRDKEAILYFKKALEYDSNFHEAYYNLGNIKFDNLKDYYMFIEVIINNQKQCLKRRFKQSQKFRSIRSWPVFIILNRFY